MVLQSLGFYQGLGQHPHVSGSPSRWQTMGVWSYRSHAGVLESPGRTRGGWALGGAWNSLGTQILLGGLCTQLLLQALTFWGKAVGDWQGPRGKKGKIW